MSDTLASKIKKRATIEDVARRAGVSIKTVSRVANDEPNVRQSTRAKVAEAIADLEYLPDPSARSLASRRSYLIGLLHDNPSASYLISIQNGALGSSREAGYNLLLHPCDYRDPEIAADIRRMVRRTKVEGLVLTPPLSDRPGVRELLDELGLPYVRVAPADALSPDTSIFTNDVEISAEMVRYLHSLGHRKIGFIIGHPDHGAVLLRHQGFLQGMQEVQLEVKPEYVAQGYNSFESGIECAQELLNLPDRPTAIFASNDEMAAGVIHVAHEMRIDIPGQLSVAGYDDVPLARQLWPALTTVRQPMEQMARSATSLLVQMIKTRQDETEVQTTIDGELIIRDSTAPPQ
ncbi:MAG: LacI family DNA-binding transcriptional regulator [Gammaproteobacteria bacterium]|nr:LacI family DNA-binding transcriptional regulator [Gammaproteobacteria bacterium]